MGFKRSIIEVGKTSWVENLVVVGPIPCPVIEVGKTSWVENYEEMGERWRAVIEVGKTSWVENGGSVVVTP